MKKIFLIAVIIVAASLVSAQKKSTKQETTTHPDELQTATSTGVIILENQEYYWYQPKPDITTYELAKLLPLFSGVAYGMGEWSTREGAIVPLRDRMNRGGWPVNGTVLQLNQFEIEKIGTAIRHLERLPLRR